MTKQKRKLTAKHQESFGYDGRDVVGYMVGGELRLTKPSRDQQQVFEGDWCEITQANVWSMIHNTNRMPVTFWSDNGKEFTTYYPHWSDDNLFNVVSAKIVAIRPKRVKKSSNDSPIRNYNRFGA